MERGCILSFASAGREIYLGTFFARNPPALELMCRSNSVSALRFERHTGRDETDGGLPGSEQENRVLADRPASNFSGSG